MRYYYLKIDGKIICKLDEKNPIAPRLVFNIANFGNLGDSRPSNITLYNMPTSLFTQAESYKGKTIELRAGIKATGFSKIQGLKSTETDIIYLGKIENVVTAWWGKETYITFLINSLGKADQAKFVAQIDRGDSIATKIKDLIDKYLQGLNYNVTIDANAQDVLSPTTSTIPLQPSKEQMAGLRYFNDFLLKFGLIMSLKGQNIIIRKLDELPTQSGSNQIDAVELITQPVFEKIDVIKIEVALNPKYTLLSKVALPANIPLAPSEDLSSADAGGIIRADTKGSLLSKGTYLITSVMHLGDSRNSDVESWATSMLCQRQG